MSESISKSFSTESRKAWIASIVFHLLLAFILFFTHLEETRRVAGFVEVTLGSFGSAPVVRSPELVKDIRPEGASRPSASVVVKGSQSMKMNLPERKFPIADEILRLPEPKKIEVAEQTEKKTEAARAERRLGEKDFGLGSTLDAEKLAGEGKRGTAGEGAGFTSSTVGADIGRTIGYSIQWVGGGTRHKLSGDLPIYPEGLNLEAQIRLQAVVAPDGSVKSVHPTQKAHVRFEEAGMREVRLWKFERLSSVQPQEDQTCTITFNFKLN